MKHWKIGSTYPTQAIVTNIEPCGEPLAAIASQSDREIVLRFVLGDQDVVYGLGQNLGGIDKRGRRYTSYCTDDPHHTEDKTALYGAHNFLMVHTPGEAWRGLYIDFAGEVTFDVGYTKEDLLEITIHGGGFSLYVHGALTADECVRAFRVIFGKPYVPPKWAFGYFQSRWGYKCEADLLGVQAQFKANDIPLEGIYVDIDYMERYKDFTINTEAYPNFKGLVSHFKAQNQYLIPIIDAGVKIEKGYPVYEEGIKGGHFVTDDQGDPYVAAVWPGRVHFPDFFQAHTRKWFGDWYKYLIDLGIVGIWNDMNEPAIFYDERALEAAIDTAIASKGKNLDIDSYFKLGDAFRGLSNKVDYYKTMRHQYEGGVVDNHSVHNLYGAFMTQAAYEGFQMHMPDGRPLILSRASHVGMHRYGGIWTGDNSSWWSHLALNVRQMPSLSMVGFLYSGADTGGFGGNANGELLSRWLQFSVFTPLLRNHAALGTRDQEPYQFSGQYTQINKALITIRYRLLPFLYSEFMKAYHHDDMLFRPLSFVYEGQRVREIDDQIMLGEGVMLAPVVSPNVKGRMVHLPEPMTLVSLTEGGQTLVDVPMGDIYMPYALGCVQFFVRPGHMVPLVAGAMNSAQVSTDEVIWAGSLKLTDGLAPDLGLNYCWYDDDGQSQSALRLGAQWRKFLAMSVPQGRQLAVSHGEVRVGTWLPKPDTKHILDFML